MLKEYFFTPLESFALVFRGFGLAQYAVDRNEFTQEKSHKSGLWMGSHFQEIATP